MPLPIHLLRHGLEEVTVFEQRGLHGRRISRVVKGGAAAPG